MPLLAQTIADLVRADGEPRACAADDDTQHMLFRDGGMVRSCLLEDWPAMQRELAAKEQARQDALALRAAVRDRLTGTAGVKIDDLTVGQLRVLLAYLLWKEGAIAKDGTVKPIDTWGRD